LANNTARTEDSGFARLLDANLQECYAGHPNHIIISNIGKDFRTKIARAVEGVGNSIGIANLSIGTMVDPSKYLLDKDYMYEWPQDVKIET